jgi:type IV fimbrial biogenesis protein FimT
VLNAFTQKQSGFSLIELLIGIVIVGILMAIAAPSFQTSTRNAQIRNAAESIANGMQRARAEAVALNKDVAFSLVGTDTSWTVSVVTPASGIESRSGSEGSKGVTRTVTPVGATTVTFDNFGSAKPTNSGGAARLVQVDLTTSGGTQDLRVTVGPGGNVRMCDPNAPSGVSRC